MLYLDTSCLVNLYYPEWNSAAVASAVAGATICLTILHELELTTALELKVFRGEATPAQTAAARGAVEEDVGSGKIVRSELRWTAVWEAARNLAATHAASTGSRALDTLHVAAAIEAGRLEFLTTDTRQQRLASAAGLALRAL